MAVVDVEDPELPAKVNAGWWRMAIEYGVIDHRREFLLNVNYSDPDEVEPQYAWIRVRLDGLDRCGRFQVLVIGPYGRLFRLGLVADRRHAA